MDQSNKSFTFKKTVSTIALAYSATMAVTIAVQFLLNFLFGRFFPSFLNGPYYIWFASIIPLYCFGFPVAWLIFKKIPDNESNFEPVSMPAKNFIKLFLIGYAFMYTGNIISLGISALISVLTGKSLLNPINAAIQNSNIIMTFISTVIIAPLGEEFLFRYLPYKKLSKYGDKSYILVTALFFGLFHMNLFQIIYAFLLGIILAYMYSRTKNMVYNISLHMIINFMGGIIGIIIQNNEIALTIFGIIAMIFVITGAVLFFMNLKKAVFSVPAEPVQSPAKNTFLNLGVICFIVLFIVDVVVTIILS